MLNPYEIESLTDRKIFQVDLKRCDVYLISQFPIENVGSLYEHPVILRSILLKENTLSKELSINLYNSDQSNSVNYILNDEPREFFVFSFQLNSENEKFVDNKLDEIKKNRSLIYQWIKEKCQLKEIELKDLKKLSFPEYKMPSIQAKITDDNKEENTTISHASFTTLTTTTISNDFDWEKTSLSFKIGSSSFELAVRKFEDKKSSKLKILFNDEASLNAWKTFMIAMKLRSDQI